MVQTLLHTEPLQCSADAFWEACKHLDDLLPALKPDHFTKSVFLQGFGGPGSIRVVKMGPAITHDRDVTERMDKIDEATKSFGYTVLEGYPQYSSFSAEMTFVPVDETSSKVEWIGKYEPIGDVGPPVYIKERAVLVFKTLEHAALSSKTLSHTDVLDASIDAIWEASKHVNEWLPKALPEFFASSSYVQGHGEPGSIRVVKLGPAIPDGGELKERLDFFDEAHKAIGYTVLEGDPRYLFFSGVMKFVPGPTAGTTEATWTATYIPVGDMGPPEHIKATTKLVFKALADAAKAK
jgi:hypothetical protein